MERPDETVKLFVEPQQGHAQQRRLTEIETATAVGDELICNPLSLFSRRHLTQVVLHEPQVQRRRMMHDLNGRIQVGEVKRRAQNRVSRQSGLPSAIESAHVYLAAQSAVDLFNISAGLS